ncbi:DivIVA domain-containing protein [Microlunatus parietis]|uniref:DivIVA domain-containing protein n=1 Tax=Microlunatus parietis TaxID=682979 RepID=A0A7Y9I4S2_9ACTN|nr:DivIVA domain-containing protein [Microlunatus parietis]NYE70263.1 DivIVA domain-containing protein [Microlunatus parietis]
MEWFIAALVVVALGVVAVAGSGKLGGMSREPDRDVYRQNPWPDDQPVTAADVSDVKFGITLRGYAMDQVDDVLDRLAGELAERDATIADLKAKLAANELR